MLTSGQIYNIIDLGGVVCDNEAKKYVFWKQYEIVSMN